MRTTLHMKLYAFIFCLCLVAAFGYITKTLAVRNGVDSGSGYDEEVFFNTEIGTDQGGTVTALTYDRCMITAGHVVLQGFPDVVQGEDLQTIFQDHPRQLVAQRATVDNVQTPWVDIGVPERLEWARENWKE